MALQVMVPNDDTLLRDYVQRRVEVSFRTLAQRYLGLIFHTALRRTGNLICTASTRNTPRNTSTMRLDLWRRSTGMSPRSGPKRFPIPPAKKNCFARSRTGE